MAFMHAAGPGRGHDAAMQQLLLNMQRARWQAVRDETSGGVYYWNAKTGASAWERPMPLAPGWEEVISNTSGGVYYWNIFTGAAAWERPTAQPPLTAPPLPTAAPPQPDPVQLTDDHVAFDAASGLTAFDASDAASQPGVFSGHETEGAAIDATGGTPNAPDEPAAAAAEPVPEEVFSGHETEGAAIDATGGTPNAPDEPAAAAAEPMPEESLTINTLAAAHQDAAAHQVSEKEFAAPTTAAGAPTGDTLNEPEQRAPTTGPHPHVSFTKIDYAVGSCAKVGPLSRIRIEDEAYTKTTRAAFAPRILRRTD
jgi:hypothetical protein